MSEPATLMEAAADVARVAGDVALRYFRTSVDAETKPDGTPVTIADRSAERAAREWIERRFPDDGLVGEEHGVSRPDARRRWILDPIDGTQSFVRRVPLWGTLVAVAEGEEILAGAAFFPAIDELLVAAPGAGCWWNGARSRVSTVSTLERATILTTDQRFPGRATRREAWSALAARARVVRTWGDCYGYLMVATGRADVMVDDRMALWDAAPLLPIVREAGGVFTDWKGVPTAFGGDAIATNATLADETRALLVPSA